jgi:o-succinylbenzoate synthase
VVRLIGIELVRVRIPFRSAIGTSAGVHEQRDLLYVRVVTDAGEGWGECAALGQATSVDPGVDSVDQAAVATGVPRILRAAAAREGELPSYTDMGPLFGNTPSDRMLGATFEMAVRDLALRVKGQSLSQMLEVGEGFESLPVGAAIGIPPERDLGLLAEQVAAAVSEGAARIRLKIAPGWDTEPTAAIRERHPDLVLQLDANGAYDLADTDHLNELSHFDVLCLEQPMSPADLAAHAELARRMDVPICLDESLSTPRRVRDAIRNESCRMACLKPGRLGGIVATRAAHAACAEAGVAVFVGGFFETGLARSANLALAARLAQDAPGLVSDVSDPSSYLATDPCGYPTVHRGWVRVPDQPGVGPGPDELELANLGAHRRWFPATYT